MKTLIEKREFLTRQIVDRKAAIRDATVAIEAHMKAIDGLYGALETVAMIDQETHAGDKPQNLDLSDAPQNLE